MFCRYNSSNFESSMWYIYKNIHPHRFYAFFLINVMLIQVSVNELDLQIPIGWFDEERIIKTRVLVSLHLEYQSNRINDDLSNTIDYAEMHQLLKDCVREYKLLETYGEVVLNAALDRFTNIQLTFGVIEITKKQILEGNSKSTSQVVKISRKY